MGWSYGFVNGRDVGYGVPAICDHPTCNVKIDRGISYICGGDIGGGEHGCGLFFCEKHMHYTDAKTDDGEYAPQLCEVCVHNFELGLDAWRKYRPAFKPKPDVPKWLRWKLRDAGWREWRQDNPKEVTKMRAALAAVARRKEVLKNEP